MKTVEINLAIGSDVSIDPRIAPNGTLARVQNARIDKQGRLVTRAGYQSLGVTVHDSATLVPFDLHNFNGTLVALGNNSLANQTGIRAAYELVNTFKGAWRTTPTTVDQSDTSAGLMQLPAGDGVRILRSDVVVSEIDDVTSDVAITSDGRFLCSVTSRRTQPSLNTRGTYVTILDRATGNVVEYKKFQDVNAKVLCTGTVFLLFTQIVGGTTINIATFNPTTQTQWSAQTAIQSPGTADSPYDVAMFDGTTDFLIVVPTGTGYRWTRAPSVSPFVSISTLAVVSLANAPVAISGSNASNTISVVNVRTTSGFEIRTFNATTSALVLGPTNLDFNTFVYDAVCMGQVDSTHVMVIAHNSGPGAGVPENQWAFVNTATLAASSQEIDTLTRVVGRPVVVDGVVFAWMAIGGAGSPCTYALYGSGIPSGSGIPTLSAIVLDGAAKDTFASPTNQFVGHIAVAGRTLTVQLVAKEIGNTFRAHTVSVDVFSGARRQGVTLGGQLFLAGGLTTQFDGVMATGSGFECEPCLIGTPQQGAGGALTLLGVYQYVALWRVIGPDGSVMRSGPSLVSTVTLVSANQTIAVQYSAPWGLQFGSRATSLGYTVFLDIFRTEAGGSIPRLVGSVSALDSSLAISGTITFSDAVADTVQQSGAPIYTQGSAGAVSGRLPLGAASPSRFLADSNGKLLLAGLERDTQMQLSVESRPGESLGFVNDDVFFVTNPETVTGLATGTNGRRIIFSQRHIRELAGDGPNAAGIGDLGEPLEIDGQIGCNDWRSIVRTEHGIFFRASDSKIYLLPVGGGGAATGAAVSAGEGIRDILLQFPVTTSAVRHEADQLVTFTLQSADGTDGRIVHLDLKTSGMGQSGWVGHWIVDRLNATEPVAEIQVLAEIDVIFGANATPTINLPRSRQIGDRLLAVVQTNATTFIQGILANAPGGVTGVWSSLGFVFTNNGVARILERIVDGTETDACFCGLSGTNASCAMKVWHLRGAHPTTPSELVLNGLQSSATLDPSSLTPSWGSARTLWFAVAIVNDLALPAAAVAPTVFPSGFIGGNVINQRATLTAANSNQIWYARRSLLAATLDPTPFVAPSSVNWSTYTVAVRPAVPAVAGSPVRAGVEYQGRLVVCTATDVLQSTAGVFSDQGGLFVGPELETADVYAMGPGGAARHLSVVLLGEFLDRCTLDCALSYDSGRTYVECAPFVLNASGYTVGETVRLQWVPKRRKVDGVRARITVRADGTAGPSQGIAIHRLLLVFEELLGPTRLAKVNRG